MANKRTPLKEVSHTNGKIEIPKEFKPTPVSARNPNQKEYIKSIKQNVITITSGPAGTGKSFISVAIAIEKIYSGEIDKIIVTRPVLEACGERMGFLPGSLSEKIDPYLKPIWDAIDELLPPEEAKKFKHDNIEVCPLAFMRGRSLKRRYIIADEMSNATEKQILMLITRIGEGSTLIMNGDPTQSDLPGDLQGGLIRIINIIQSDPDVGIVTFNKSDIVRHPIIARILSLIEKDAEVKEELPPRTLEQTWSMGDGTCQIERDFEDEVW